MEDQFEVKYNADNKVTKIKEFKLLTEDKSPLGKKKKHNLLNKKKRFFTLLD